MATRIITHGSVEWVDIVHPSPDDVEKLQDAHPYFHPLNLEDIRSPIERPKIDDDEQYMFVVMHFPLWDSRHEISRASEVNFFVGKGYVVTVHNGTLKPLTKLYEDCEESENDRKRLLGRGANHAFYTIIDQLVDYIFPILRRVDTNIHKIEDDLFVSDAIKVIRDIALVRRDIIALRRMIRHQIPILESLEHSEHPVLHEDLEEYFGDIADHLYKQRDIVEENYEIINSFADSADTLASHRINEVIRILTVFSVIMLPLTFISSVYGMNIDLPFQDHPNSFIITCGVMSIIATLMLIYFRRRNWL